MLKNFKLRNSAPLKTIAIFILSGILLNTVLFFNLPAIKAEENNDKAVVINEFQFNPTLGNEWIELYNTSTTEIDITGWKVLSRAGLVPLLDMADTSLSGTIPGKSFLYLEVSKPWILNDWDVLILKNEDNILIDTVTYTINADGTITLKGKNLPFDSIFEGDSVGRRNDGALMWCVFKTPSKNKPNKQGDCRKREVPTSTPTSEPTATPTTIVTTTPVATTTPVVITNTPEPTTTIAPVQTTPVVTATVQATPVRNTNQSVVPTKQGSNTVAAPFANQLVTTITNVQGGSVSQTTPTVTATPTITPSAAATIRLTMNESSIAFEAKEGEFVELISNFNTCDQFDSLSFRVKKGIKGKLTVIEKTKSDYKNMPFESKELSYGVCELASEGFEGKDIDNVRIKTRYSEEWLQNNKFVTEQLKLFVAESDVTKLDKKYDINKTEDKKINDKEYDVIVSSIETLPKAFAIAPDGISSIVRETKSSFPWWILIVAAGALVLALTLLLIPRKPRKENDDETEVPEEEEDIKMSIF